jgi:hypothetical protein
MQAPAVKNTETSNFRYRKDYDPIVVRPDTVENLVQRLIVKTGNRSLQMLRVNDDTYCPSEKPRMVTFATVSHKRNVSTEVAIRDMEENNVRPANLKELLHFFLHYGDLYDGREIAALGTKKVGSIIDKKNTDEFVFYLSKETIGVADKKLLVADKNTRAVWPTRVDFLGVVNEESMD